MSLLASFRHDNLGGCPLEAVEEGGSYCSSANSISSSFDESSSSSSKESVPTKSSRTTANNTTTTTNKLNSSGSTIMLSSETEMMMDGSMQKQQLFYEVALLDEHLLPDNGLLLRTWSSLTACLTKSPSFWNINGNQKSVSYSPRSFQIISALHILRSSSILKVILAFLTLILTPFAFFGNTIPTSSIVEIARAVITGWDSLAHFSIYPVCILTLFVSFIFAHSSGHGICYKKSDVSKKDGIRNSCCDVCAWITPPRAAQIIVLFFSLSVSITSQLQIIQPSWIWNPLLWMGNYKVYLPSDLQPALDGLCLDYETTQPSKDPLCLSEHSWDVLSAGALSSKNSEDVKAVLDGLNYVRDQSGGIVINVMSRDTIDAIEPLRMNIEGLLPFFPKLAVLVFENDSVDGSRQAFQLWSQEAKGYSVDLMECPGTTDCKFGESHRYDATEAADYFRSSAIGNMAKFRQRMVDYLVSSEKYDNFSHMVVLDLDLGISFSPLGILHSLGKMPDNAVASSGRQVWPGSFGSLVPPYDFSAFRPFVTKRNEYTVNLHKKFCSLMPPGDRWRNQCDAVSPMQLMMVLSHDRLPEKEMYRVESAFNGGTIYPIQLIRESHAQYNDGEDGQRCEHIGFNLSLKKPMYVNPKWDFHISPTKPGGPTGVRALKNIVRIVFTPRLSALIFFQNIGCMTLFVFSVMYIGMFLIYPLFVRSVFGRRRMKRTSYLLTTDASRIQHPSEFDFNKSSAPKRKLSDFVTVKHV
mmetsp:Transcript_6760/g.9829  ORF Transcript_6760/g.9829 Transcript_6760/m.9829 type:complete len:752 (-) Transcript_6760:25-2280(-)|eukprot:CAMPEP_0172421406 /NCGR_PEP_ID=MMETSP1064-20121228/7651_1 /TAXON_ID=202472 /ORGANISM="Aulacoseira subarctica , Strain CCAP 1002/5" /LENGTH=751 /DNA_ID=CAMNT_0013161787 /DNA_START=210 /DNA_END=2465 /DNA_ORIENTATION=+